MPHLRSRRSRFTLRPTTTFALATSLLVSALMLSEARAQDVPGVPTSQPAPSPQQLRTYEILGLSVEGASDEDARTFARSVAGLRAGDQVTLPWDQSFGEAIRDLYQNGLFSDAEVVVDQIVGDGVFLTLRVREEPRLAGYDINGYGGGEDEIRKELPLLRGRAVRPAEVEQARMTLERGLRREGYRLASVSVDREVIDEGRVQLTFTVDRGEKLEVQDVRFVGNEAFGEGTLRKQLPNTPENRWWRIWKGETFKEEEFRDDLDNLVRFYNDNGYYGARVLRDSVYLTPPDAENRGVVVEIEVEEGPQYAVRDVVFEGNTVFTDAQLQQALNIERGDIYDRSQIETNLYYTEAHTDITSLYSDRGYLRFNIQQQVVEAPGDSLDLYFEVSEGDVYEFGEVRIAGNTRTKDHVIRRELRTVPGQRYSRQAIERSVRELGQLKYFEQNSLARGPDVSINEEDKTVDLAYDLTETSSDQLELSGGWGGSIGLLLTARVTFNNFSIQNVFNGSAWRPLPAGDGQQLSLQVVTSGTRYQNYSLSFTEPWFRGRPTPVGFSLGFSNYSSRSSDDFRIARGYGNVFIRQRLNWPDDYFTTGSRLGFTLYDITGSDSYAGLPEGINRELTVRQSLSRNALDSPIFPSSGSNLDLSLTLAPPLPGFIQYHKWDFSNDWYAPLTSGVSVAVKSRFGYIGSLTGGAVEFERYLVGGSPLESSQGYRNFGKDLVFLRGYPAESIGPRQDGDAVGGRILNKYQTEVQWVAVRSQQLSLAPYVFVDAANAWDSFDDYNPARLYRSAGFGARVFLPILGMVDLSYGYQIDRFDPLRGGETGEPQWRFQFSLGGQ